MDKTHLLRMWGIKDAAELLKQQDPHTGITAYHIRRLCLDNKIKFERVGAGKNAKYLVNVDSMIEYFANPPAEPKRKPNRQSLSCSGWRNKGVILVDNFEILDSIENAQSALKNLKTVISKVGSDYFTRVEPDVEKLKNEYETITDFINIGLDYIAIFPFYTP